MNKGYVVFLVRFHTQSFINSVLKKQPETKGVKLLIYYENLRLPAACAIFALSNFKILSTMRDYSIPPYNIVEIGEEVKRIGERLGIHCNLA